MYPHGASAERILLFGLFFCTLPVDFNDGASYLLVLGANHTFLVYEGLNSVDSQNLRF